MPLGDHLCEQLYDENPALEAQYRAYILQPMVSAQRFKHFLRVTAISTNRKRKTPAEYAPPRRPSFPRDASLSYLRSIWRRLTSIRRRAHGCDLDDNSVRETWSWSAMEDTKLCTSAVASLTWTHCCSADSIPLNSVFFFQAPHHTASANSQHIIIAATYW